MCDFQIDYRFFNSKSSTIKTEKIWKWNVTLRESSWVSTDYYINMSKYSYTMYTWVDQLAKLRSHSIPDRSWNRVNRRI